MPSAGVSNFDLSELRELWLMANVKPAVVQRNSDPLNPDTLVQQYARLTGMQYQVGINALWALASLLKPLDPTLLG